jgi:hypothetical protein
VGLFVCDLCGCVENTALGHFWGRDFNSFGPELAGKVLCSECSPSFYIDGGANEDGGKWHGEFPKVVWDGKREMMNRPIRAVPEGKQKKVYLKNGKPPRITRAQRRKAELESRKATIITMDEIHSDKL